MLYFLEKVDTLIVEELRTSAFSSERSEFVTQYLHLIALLLWVSCFTSLCLICKADKNSTYFIKYEEMYIKCPMLSNIIQ